MKYRKKPVEIEAIQLTVENIDKIMEFCGDKIKSHHIILLDNGQIVLQPNNRIKWSEPSFVTKPFPDKPDFLVNKDWFNYEGHEKWATENSERMFYDTE